MLRFCIWTCAKSPDLTLPRDFSPSICWQAQATLKWVKMTGVYSCFMRHIDLWFEPKWLLSELWIPRFQTKIEPSPQGYLEDIGRSPSTFYVRHHVAPLWYLLRDFQALVLTSPSPSPSIPWALPSQTSPLIWYLSQLASDRQVYSGTVWFSSRVQPYKSKRFCLF